MEEQLPVPTESQALVPALPPRRRFRLFLISASTGLVLIAAAIAFLLLRDTSPSGGTVNENGNSSAVSLFANATVPKDGPADADGDGLTDAEESSHGTNPKKTDSDGDGLFDLEEVNVYRSDPLKSDSDSDGFIDGEEVKGGFDPNGTGRLLDLSAALTNEQPNQ